MKLFRMIVSLLLTSIVIFAFPFSNVKASEEDSSDPRDRVYTYTYTYYTYIIQKDGTKVYLADYEDGITYSVIETRDYLTQESSVVLIREDEQWEFPDRQTELELESTIDNSIVDMNYTWFERLGFSEDDIQTEDDVDEQREALYFTYDDVYMETVTTTTSITTDTGEILPPGTYIKLYRIVNDRKFYDINESAHTPIIIDEEQYNQLRAEGRYADMTYARDIVNFDIHTYIDLRQIDGDIELVFPDYSIVRSEDEGNVSGETAIYDKNSQKGFTFVVKDFSVEDDYLTMDDLLDVLIDGKTIDPSNYTVSTGCIVITLTPSFMDSLEAGEHTVTAKINDGGKCSLTFSVKQDEESLLEESLIEESATSEVTIAVDDTTSIEPSTSAVSHPSFHISTWMLFSAAILLIVVIIVILKKKKH